MTERKEDKTELPEQKETAFDWDSECAPILISSMIKEAQEKYLASLPDGRVIEVKPFDPRARDAGEKIVQELAEALPGLSFQFGGAAALGIAGQNDIDILILSTPPEFGRHLPTLERMFGAPTRIGKSGSRKWEFKRAGFDVELYLTDKDSGGAQEQLKIFELLSRSKELRDEYERVKLPYGPIDFKEYMRKKYAFYNRVLDR